MKSTTLKKSLTVIAIVSVAVLGLPTRVPFISTGFGAHGTWAVVHDSTGHPQWKGQFVHCFRPAGVSQKCPVVLFCHGITETHPRAYQALIDHMVSRGMVIIYSPYGTPTAMSRPMVAYRAMWAGFEKGMSTWDTFVDESRLGIVGHSYGGGAAPWVTRQATVSRKWGRSGTFLFVMAPWYVHGLSQKRLRRFPKHVKVLVQVYEDDCVNDHRMGKDIYRTIGVPDTEKGFVVVNSDYSEERPLIADHNVPLGATGESSDVNALDYYAIYRLFDALAEYALNSDAQAGRVALGSTGPECICMGTWADGRPVREMTRPDRLRMVRTQQFCVNFWHHVMNPRMRFYRRLNKPMRIVLHTPVTLWNYCMLVQQRLDK